MISEFLEWVRVPVLIIRARLSNPRLYRVHASGLDVGRRVAASRPKRAHFTAQTGILLVAESAPGGAPAHPMNPTCAHRIFCLPSYRAEGDKRHRHRAIGAHLQKKIMQKKVRQLQKSKRARGSHAGRRRDDDGAFWLSSR